MIDTAYTLTPFPVSPSLSSPIAFKQRPGVVADPHTPAAVVEPGGDPAAEASVVHRTPGRWLYFGVGMVLLFLVIQAGDWTPFDGVDLMFIRLLLFVGAGVCFLASSDGQGGVQG